MVDVPKWFRDACTSPEHPRVLGTSQGHEKTVAGIPLMQGGMGNACPCPHEMQCLTVFVFLCSLAKDNLCHRYL